MEVKDYARNTRQSGFFGCFYHITRCFPGGAVVKNPPANAGDVRDGASIPGLGRSPGGGHGNQLQCSFLENSWTEELGRLQSMGLQKVGHD